MQSATPRFLGQPYGSVALVTTHSPRAICSLTQSSPPLLSLLQIGGLVGYLALSSNNELAFAIVFGLVAGGREGQGYSVPGTGRIGAVAKQDCVQQCWGSMARRKCWRQKCAEALTLSGLGMWVLARVAG